MSEADSVEMTTTKSSSSLNLSTAYDNFDRANKALLLKNCRQVAQKAVVLIPTFKFTVKLYVYFINAFLLRVASTKQAPFCSIRMQI